MTIWTVAAFLVALFFAFLVFLNLRKIQRLSRDSSKEIERLRSTLEEKGQTARDEKKRLFAILESMTEGVIVVDTEEKVLLVNSALERYFELRRESIEGRFFWEIFRDADINQMIHKGLLDRVTTKREHSASLSTSVYEIQISPVSAGGEFLGVVAVFRDVTMLKEYERLRSEFVANVSHELKTPLTSILGFVETLKDGGVPAEDATKFLGIIETQALHLNALIEDLLTLSKIESMHDPLRLKEVDAEDLFKKIEDAFSPRLKDGKYRLRVIRPTKPVFLRAESSSLERALCNLVDNALKYNQPGGSVTLEALAEGDTIWLKVHDTGVGISLLDQARVFERFYRVEKGRSRETGGTGLGLSITKHIAERHGGRIDVESTVGKGSTFSIILPR